MSWKTKGGRLILTTMQRKAIDEVMHVIEDLRADVQEAFDAKGAKWQDSEAGQEAVDLLDSLDRSVESLERLKEQAK